MEEPYVCVKAVVVLSQHEHHLLKKYAAAHFQDGELQDAINELIQQGVWEYEEFLEGVVRPCASDTPHCPACCAWRALTPAAFVCPLCTQLPSGNDALTEVVLGPGVLVGKEGRGDAIAD
jgi:hypothetical protein